MSYKKETWLIVDPGKVCGYTLWSIEPGIARIVSAGVVSHTIAVSLFSRIAPHRMVMEVFPTGRLSWEGQKELLEGLSRLDGSTEIYKVPAQAWKGGRFDTAKSNQGAILGDHLKDALGLANYVFSKEGLEAKLCES